MQRNKLLLVALLRSRSRREPYHLVRAGVVTRFDSGSDGSGPDNGITYGEELKNDKMLQLITHRVNIFSNIIRSESNEEDSFNICFNFRSF
jgi:hypothetical protein